MSRCYVNVFVFFCAAPKGRVQNRVMFHLAEKVCMGLECNSALSTHYCASQAGDHEVLMNHHQNLQNVMEDQVCVCM